ATKHIFVAYDYNSNAIIVCPLPNREKYTIVITSNPSAPCLKRNITNLNFESINCQFVLAKEHRVNAAESAIQTFKNHFISILCATDPNFPMQLWDQLLPQAEDSLKIPCIACDDPTTSTHEILHGKHNFITHPWAPTGCKAIVHENPQTCTSWTQGN
ncbi:hypothetical protein ACHAXS_005587, partial [Conticribra weissflogii]